MDVRRLQANNYKRMDGLKVNSLGIDVGKKKCRAALKDERGDIIREFFFSNNNEGISAGAALSIAGLYLHQLAPTSIGAVVAVVFDMLSRLSTGQRTNYSFF